MNLTHAPLRGAARLSAVLLASCCALVSCASTSAFETLVPRAEGRGDMRVALNVDGGFLYADAVASAGVYQRSTIGDFQLTAPALTAFAEIVFVDWSVEPTLVYRHPLERDAAGNLVDPIPLIWQAHLLKYVPPGAIGDPLPVGMQLRFDPAVPPATDTPPEV